MIRQGAEPVSDSASYQITLVVARSWSGDVGLVCTSLIVESSMKAVNLLDVWPCTVVQQFLRVVIVSWKCCWCGRGSHGVATGSLNVTVIAAYHARGQHVGWQPVLRGVFVVRFV